MRGDAGEVGLDDREAFLRLHGLLIVGNELDALVLRPALHLGQVGEVDAQLGAHRVGRFAGGHDQAAFTRLRGALLA